MIKSLKTLYQSPYNIKHPFSALRRFLTWKVIKLFKITKCKVVFWGDREIYINHDSFHSMWLMYNNWVDWEEFNLIKEFVKPGDVVVDVGANMGYYSLWLSKFTGENGLVVAFEPDETNFYNLNENISINHLTNKIIAERKAISDECGVVNFTLNLDGENHITTLSNSKSVRIPSIKLDSYFKEKEIRRVAYLKIDVEGFELNVLKGCSESLGNGRIDILQLEINETIRNSGAAVNDILNILKLNFYVLCRYDITGNKLVEVNYSSGKANYFAVANLERINLLLDKNKKSNKLILNSVV